jgi:hypothetical protein
VTEPLSQNEARRRISRILRHGSVVIWDHCKTELAKDDLDIVDVNNVLRCGRLIEPAEPARERWRYRVHTDRMCVVVQFESEVELSVVTAWRKR